MRVSPHLILYIVVHNRNFTIAASVASCRGLRMVHGRIGRIMLPGIPPCKVGTVRSRYPAYRIRVLFFHARNAQETKVVILIPCYNLSPREGLFFAGASKHITRRTSEVEVKNTLPRRIFAISLVVGITKRSVEAVRSRKHVRLSIFGGIIDESSGEDNTTPSNNQHEATAHIVEFRMRYDIGGTVYPPHKPGFARLINPCGFMHQRAKTIRNTTNMQIGERVIAFWGLVANDELLPCHRSNS